jgi:hypothetical protein
MFISIANIFGAITDFAEHSFFQAKYLLWKFEHFKRLGVLTPESQPKLVRRIHPKTNLITQSLRFNTKSLFKQFFVPFCNGVTKTKGSFV